jgi:hypothetical protein
VTFWGYHTLAYALPAQILMIQRIWFPIQQQSYAPLFKLMESQETLIDLQKQCMDGEI